MFFCYFPGRVEKYIRENLNLIYAIAIHYYTEESTRYLASILLNEKDDLFIAKKLSECTAPNCKWSNLAIEVIWGWTDWNLRANSITLLNAMERSNKEAADFFQDVLTNGRYLSFGSSLCVHTTTI